MERKNNIPLPGQVPAGGDRTAALFSRLDTLNAQVHELLNDPAIRRMVLDVGIVLLSKKYPALGVLLGSLGGAKEHKSAQVQPFGNRAATIGPPPRHISPTPAKKNGRGIR
ncbi:MAG: hypothetical protein LBU98_03395 [Alistipes sp.]|jgi:hypothetical protein|nr:hypothetical protein [Alistipes sp.]